MVFFNSKKLIDQLIQDFDQAQSSIEVEVYILDPDSVGRILEEALIRAHRRGLKVCLIVDRVGSFNWIRSRMDDLVRKGIEVRVFRPMFGLKTLFNYSSKNMRFVLGALNRRNHRKVFTIDKKISYIGSFNFLDEALKWKEATIRITDEECIRIIHDFFEYTWEWIEDEQARFRQYESQRLIDAVMASDKIRTTQIKKLRSHYRRDFIHMIDSAQQRIWLVTPYFNAPRFLLKALVRAAKRGVDVRLMVPAVTDPIWFSYLSRLYYSPLVQRGLKIFEYQPAFLHSKTALIDSRGIVGSGNLNYRSFYQDLETNIITSDPQDVEALREEFIRDMAYCHEVKTPKEMKLWERVFGAFLTVFKTSF